MVKSEKESYVGPEAILKHIYKNKDKYGDKENINLDSLNISFIISTLKDFKLSKPHKKRVKGGSEYQHYPKELISQIGEFILEFDFVQRFIKGQTKPLHFIGFSCKRLKLRQYKQITGQTHLNTKQELEWFINNFFIPDAVKMDNDMAFIGTGSGKRTISKTVGFLFDEKIIPIFTNPRSPWNNGSVEGSNSVFARNFWNKSKFTSPEDVDEKLKLFNQSSLEYSDYKQDEFEKKTSKEKKYVSQIYFIRKVYERNNKGEINVLNERIELPKEYISLYTLSKWNLKEKMLYIYFENEGKKILIKKLEFKINENSKIKINF